MKQYTSIEMYSSKIKVPQFLFMSLFSFFTFFFISRLWTYRLSQTIRLKTWTMKTLNIVWLYWLNCDVMNFRIWTDVWYHTFIIHKERVYNTLWMCLHLYCNKKVKTDYSLKLAQSRAASEATAWKKNNRTLSTLDV